MGIVKLYNNLAFSYSNLNFTNKIINYIGERQNQMISFTILIKVVSFMFWLQQVDSLFYITFLFFSPYDM